MYSLLPSFVLGFHGCDQAVAETVLAGQSHLAASKNKYDWLGEGVYFWENSPARAMAHAQNPPDPSKRNIKSPAVIGAVIDLGHCLNLLDAQFIDTVKDGYAALGKACRESGVELPRNRPPKNTSEILLRDLDCAVINMVHSVRAEKSLRAFDSVRSAFIEGQPLYRGSAFFDRNHIQLCICNMNCIKGYFRPLPDRGF